MRSTSPASAMQPPASPKGWSDVRFLTDETATCINCGDPLERRGDSRWYHRYTGIALCPTATYASPALA